MPIDYRDHAGASTEELTALYDSVGWTAYTCDPERLRAAVDSSMHVVTARAAGHLVGLARVVGDGQTIVYLQDILVDPAHHRQGVGRELFTRVLAPYGAVRQQVLMTDGDPAQRAFYTAMGFTEVHEMTPAMSVYARLS